MDSKPSPLGPRLRYATHNADHVALNPAQRLAVQHLREQLQRLLRKRDSYASFIRSADASPMGMGKQPNPDQQDSASELTQSFFEQVYATLSALASVHGRIELHLAETNPPISSNDKFLVWWRTVDRGGGLSAHIDTLQAARDFRTLFMHPQMWPVFDWATVGRRDDIRIVLHGAPSSKGNIPVGSSPVRGGTSWEFLAPDMDEVLVAFEYLCQATFLPIFTWYSETKDAPCLWEPDGIGSSVGDVAARKLRETLSSDTLDTETKARMSPKLLKELNEYITAMTDIRQRANDSPVPSAYPSGIPAARPSRSLPSPFGGVEELGKP